jgi:hypothetical protein
MFVQELALGSSGSRLARRKALGLGAGGAEGRRRHRVVAGGMADDGSYVGPGGASFLLILVLHKKKTLIYILTGTHVRHVPELQPCRSGFYKKIKFWLFGCMF